MPESEPPRRVSMLVDPTRHVHDHRSSGAQRDDCAVCGLDLRDLVHRRVGDARLEGDLLGDVPRQLRDRAEIATLREGLRFLGYAMRDGDCHRIRDKWGGDTPEDWCGEADALHGILERLREEREGNAERDALLRELTSLFCACDGPAETVRGSCEYCGEVRLSDALARRLRLAGLSSRVRVRVGWGDAGRVGRLLYRTTPMDPSEQAWAVVVWDGDDEPSLFKDRALEVLQDA